MISAAFLVKDPPLDRLAMLVAYLRPAVSDFVFVIDSRTDPITRNVISTWADATVLDFTWVDDFSAARNAALPHCKGEWTLHLDPDELPSKAMLDFIAMVDRSEWQDIEWRGMIYPAARGYLFFTKNYEDGVQGPEWEEHWHTRLLRTDRARWYRPVHELVSLDGYEESLTRNTPLLVKAPRSAYLIHSKMSDKAPASTELYTRIESLA